MGNEDQSFRYYATYVIIIQCISNTWHIYIYIKSITPFKQGLKIISRHKNAIYLFIMDTFLKRETLNILVRRKKTAPHFLYL
jgi:hypothetical protein